MGLFGHHPTFVVNFPSSRNLTQTPAICFFTLNLITVLLLLSFHFASSESPPEISIEITSQDDGHLVGIPYQPHPLPNTGTKPNIYCSCDSPGKLNCSATGRCQSVSGCCRANIWFEVATKKLSLLQQGCSAPVPYNSVSHSRGGQPGDAIFVLYCCGISGCNNWTDDDVEPLLLPELCNYTTYMHDDGDALEAFRNHCRDIAPVNIGPFSLVEFTLLLFIPVALSICVVCVVLVYTRQVHHCSVLAWKQCMARFFSSPKCVCVRYRQDPERSHSRTSDASTLQPLVSNTHPQQQLHVLHTPTSTNNNSSNVSSITDSGFSNGGRLKKMSLDSQTSKVTLQSSLMGSMLISHRPSFASTPLNTSNFSSKLQHSPPHTEMIVCDTIGEVTNSGSGAGVPSLGRRTLAYQIHLKQMIGFGRYGVVHQGEMFGDQVAVKIFKSHDERAWLREKQIYSTQGMQHENILVFRGADSKDTGLATELWLVTEYHPNGSLFDFLSQRTVTLNEALKLMHSLVAGLSHLHLEVSGTPGKPAIAHRDLKSRNVLIKSNHSCCLADFGFAVTCSGNQLEQSPQSGVGTRRYMSNELLDETFNANEFSSYAAADLYALGLVFWEILRRADMPNSCADAVELPFAEYNVGPDPSHDIMKRFVCLEKRRPTIPSRFVFLSPDDTVEDQQHLSAQEHIASSLAKLVDELWQEMPLARPNALLVKRLLIRLREMLIE